MNDWIPSLNSLRAFESVSRHLSYKLAAQELRVTPAAVKQLIVKLEDAVGRKLLTRVGNQLVLSEQGAASRQDLELAMRYMSGAVRKMRENKGDSRLIVSVESSIATNWLVPRLEAFRALNPGIDVLIDSNQRIVDLHRNDADIAIRYGVPPQSGLVAHRLFEDFVVPACHPKLMEENLDPISVEELSRLPLIHWDMSHLPWAEKTHFWFSWTSWFERRGAYNVDLSNGLWFNDFGLAMQAAVSGQGVVLAGWPAMLDPLRTKMLICPLPDEVEATQIGFDLVTTEDMATTSKVSSFVDWLTEVAIENRSPYENREKREC